MKLTKEIFEELYETYNELEWRFEQEDMEDATSIFTDEVEELLKEVKKYKPSSSSLLYRAYRELLSDVENLFDGASECLGNSSTETLLRGCYMHRSYSFLDLLDSTEKYNFDLYEFLTKHFDNYFKKIFDETDFEKILEEALRRKTPLEKLSKIFEDFIVDNFKELGDSYEELYNTRFCALYVCKVINKKDKKSKSELSDIIQNSEKAINTLKQLIDNNLLDQYSYTQLKKLLSREDKKQLKTRFNL